MKSIFLQNQSIKLVLFVFLCLLFSCGFSQTSVTLINGDTNFDNSVDDADLLNVINNFLMTSNPTGLITDLNGDGITDDIDLLIVINNFLLDGSISFSGTYLTGSYSIPLQIHLNDFLGNANNYQVLIRAKNQTTSMYTEQLVDLKSTNQAVTLLVHDMGQYTIQAEVLNGSWLRGQVTASSQCSNFIAPPDTSAFPTGVTNTNANKITVYWEPVPSATGYLVFRRTTSGAYNYSTPISTITGNITHWTDSNNLQNYTEYFYVVKAVSGSCTSGISDECSAIPDPTGIAWDSNDSALIISQLAAEFPDIDFAQSSVTV